MKLLAIISVLFIAGCATHQPTQAPLTTEEVRASETKDFGLAMASAKDANVQNMLILAWALRGKTEAPQQVQQAPSVAGIVLGVVDRLIGVTPAWFAYKSSIRNSQTTETVAAINRDVSIAQSNNFTQLGIAGVAGTAAVGINGMNSLATIALKPSTSITVTGNTGPSNIGGTQTNSSNNPVNPTPKVCSVSSLGVLTCP